MAINQKIRSSGLPAPTSVLPMAQSGMAQQQYVPPTGLIGSEQALQGGLAGALGTLGMTYDLARRSIGSGKAAASGAVRASERDFKPYMQGSKAYDLQLALSGAMGPEAQQQAYDEFQMSPGQQFLRDRAEQALMRQQAATGGLGGGRVQSALQEQAIGLANQAYNDRFAQLGSLSNIGFGAASNLSNARMQGASIKGSLAGQMAGITGQLGALGANAYLGTGSQLAQGRTRAGEAIAGNVAGTGSALADLVNQQGAGAASIVGQSTGDLANILANISQNASAQYSGQPGLPQLRTDDKGILGRVTDAIGGITGAYTGVKNA